MADKQQLKEQHIATENAYFAGGCFWCIEAIFQRLPGVIKVVSGYCNGLTKNPDYHSVSTGDSGHAETVNVVYDSNKVTFTQLMSVFFQSHDSSQLNRQGADIGSQYRSAIFYSDDNQKQQALSYINKLQQQQTKAVVTEVSALDVFYPAEDYHQNYFNNNKLNRYCQVVIQPKITKLFDDE